MDLGKLSLAKLERLDAFFKQVKIDDTLLLPDPEPVDHSGQPIVHYDSQEALALIIAPLVALVKEMKADRDVLLAGFVQMAKAFQSLRIDLKVENPTPIINIETPTAMAPSVNVTVPELKKRKIRKTVIRGEDKRMIGVLEEEED